MATTAIQGLQTIPLDQITENPFNPRKHFEQGPLKELAKSIKVHGVRQPVLVRPMGKGFQLVVGARRYRASKLAGKSDIPAIVDPALDDRSALEIMVIENLQREDVHPLDEAMGYQVLMEHRCQECKAEPGFHTPKCSKVGETVSEVTVESIAAKVGKSIGYVYARLKLLAMVPAAREAFQQGHVTAGHSVLIARLQPLDQLKALGACFKSYLAKDEEAALKKLDAKSLKWDDFADALVDFSFNDGNAALDGSTLLKDVNEGNLDGAAAQFQLWDHAAGKVVAGLLRRRLAEEKEFTSGS